MTSLAPPVQLTISFAPAGDGAALRWEADVIGVRASRLEPPVPPAEVPLALRALDAIQDPGYPWARSAEQAAHSAFDAAERGALADLGLLDEGGHVAREAPRRLGRRLYAALTADPEARQALSTVRDHAAALGRPLALALCFPPRAAHLAALPWELLWDEGPAPMLLSRGLPGGLTRRLDLPQAAPPPPPGAGPLRILALSPAAGIGPELRQVERAARQAALAPLLARGAAVVEEVEPATRAALAAAVAARAPDVVHFYGHGRLRGAEGELLLDDEGGACWVGAGAVAAALGGAGLVALYACQGAGVAATGDEGGRDPMLGGVAQALSAAGVPAVLGMQLAVRATAATRAAAAVYGALAAGRTLDEGVAAARRALFVEERDGASWFVPALYLRGRAVAPVALRPPAAAAGGARQSVLARGGAISRLRIQGRAGSRQTVIAARGGAISDVQLVDR